MLVILILAGLVIAALSYTLFRTVQRAWASETDLASKEAGLRGSHTAAERFRALFLEREEQLVAAGVREHVLLDRLDSVRQGERARYEQREASLLAQIQTLADRIAQLKLTPVKGEEGELIVVSGGETPFFADPTIPFSADLHDFIKKIDSEEARQMVEVFIEERRAEHMDDAQILIQLERGEY